VILVFYPADWRPVCADQLPLYSQLRDEVAKLDAARLAISGGGVCWLLAFAQNCGYLLMLVSDFEPEGEVTRRYGMYRDKNGFAQRALIVLDKDGVNQWRYVSPVGFNPGADGILSALEALPRGSP
jgi:peroxiredoxin